MSSARKGTKLKSLLRRWGSYSPLTAEETEECNMLCDEHALVIKKYNAAEAVLFKEYRTELGYLLVKYEGKLHTADGFDCEQERELAKLAAGIAELKLMLSEWDDA
jgi:hypothetical protein